MTSETYLVSSRDGRVRVKFYWQRDRFAHQVSIDGHIVGDSVESDSGSPWPESPPLQQLSLEKIDGQTMVLGVGGAGRNHWSISVQPCDDPGLIRFDLACRCQEQPSFLGSKYRLANPLTLSVIDGKSKQENGASVILATDSSETTREWSYTFSVATQIA